MTLNSFGPFQYSHLTLEYPDSSANYIHHPLCLKLYFHCHVALRHLNWSLVQCCYLCRKHTIKCESSKMSINLVDLDLLQGLIFSQSTPLSQDLGEGLTKFFAQFQLTRCLTYTILIYTYYITWSIMHNIMYLRGYRIVISLYNAPSRPELPLFSESAYLLQVSLS